MNADTNGHTNDAICSTEGVAVLMLTSGSSGNAKAVCLTHKQIFGAMKGKMSGMPLPQGSTLLNWIALDHVASLVEIHMCAMFVGLNQVHVPAVEVLGDPIFFYVCYQSIAFRGLLLQTFSCTSSRVSWPP